MQQSILPPAERITRPMADASRGLTSYRYPGTMGSDIAIAARSHVEALSEARRSLSGRIPVMDKLDVWDAAGERYVPATAHNEPPSPLTRAAFLTALRAQFVSRHAWAADAAKLDENMGLIVKTLDGPRKLADVTSISFVIAWRAIGGKGPVTLRALRSLPL